MIIGLTGGIASGKTTAANILKEMGAKIIDADEIAHQILKKGQSGWRQVKKIFGPEVLKDNGEINRSLLGDIIFQDNEHRKKLEEITHPLIIDKIERKLENLETENNHIVLVVPLLYEVGLDKKVDEVWVIFVDYYTQLKRLQKRDSLSLEKAKQRIEAQLPLGKKKEWADKILDNRGNKEDLRNQIKVYWQKL